MSNDKISKYVLCVLIKEIFLILKQFLTVGYRLFFFFLISLHTPSTTHRIRLALEALQLMRKGNTRHGGIFLPHSIFILSLRMLPY